MQNTVELSDEAQDTTRFPAVTNSTTISANTLYRRAALRNSLQAITYWLSFVSRSMRAYAAFSVYLPRWLS